MNDPAGVPDAPRNGIARPPAEPSTSPGAFECLRRAVLHELAAPDRLLLLLWYAEGMSREEIAACLHSTPTQVEAAHARVLGWLRSTVERGAATA